MVEIVAEISGNHGGDIQKFEELIRTAAWCGCDYVKFQYYRPEDMPDRHEGNNEEMYQRLAVPDEWLPTLFQCALDNTIRLFASVFSVRAAKEILKYDVSYIKIASPKSTRLSRDVLEEIIYLCPADVELIGSCDKDDEGYMACGKVLYCPEGHPPVLDGSHFADFRTNIYHGFSDHTPGLRAPLAFLRAARYREDFMIEKHLKVNDNCVDAAFSADCMTMKLLCRIAHKYNR